MTSLVASLLLLACFCALLMYILLRKLPEPVRYTKVVRYASTPDQPSREVRAVVINWGGKIAVGYEVVAIVGDTERRQAWKGHDVWLTEEGAIAVMNAMYK